jgi:hypothetical protein
VADDQGRLLDLHPLLAVGRRLPQQQPLEDGARGARPLANPVKPDVDQVAGAGDGGGEQGDTLEERPGPAQAEQHRREGGRDRREGVVEHRHLDEEAAHPLRPAGRQLQGDVRPQRGPADDRRRLLEVVEQRRHLAREQRHRVEPQVLGAVGAAVPEHVDADHRVAARRQLRPEAVEHAPVHKQPVDEDQDPLALAVGVVLEPVPLVVEFAHRPLLI